MLTQPKNKGEYYLTDAFQYMIDKGAKIKVIDVEGWYDARQAGTRCWRPTAIAGERRARATRTAVFA